MLISWRVCILAGRSADGDELKSATKVRGKSTNHCWRMFFFVCLVSWDGIRWFWEKWNKKCTLIFLDWWGRKGMVRLYLPLASFEQMFVCVWLLESAPVPCSDITDPHFLGTRTWKKSVGRLIGGLLFCSSDVAKLLKIVLVLGSLGSKEFFYSKVVHVIAWRFVWYFEYVHLWRR